MPYSTFLNADLAPQLKGMIIRAGAAPGDAVLAQADTAAHSLKLLGIRIDDVAPGNSGTFNSLLEPGPRVRLAAPATKSDIIYLSDTTPGLGTTTAPVSPAISISIGICYEPVSEMGVDYASIIPIIALGGGGTPVISLTAKGDLLSHDGSAMAIVPIGGVAGQVLTVVPAAPCGLLWQNVPNPGWVTAYDLDFRTLPDQALPSNGAVTVNGTPMTVFNRANAQTFAVQNGNGLYIRCSTANTDNTTNRADAPGMYAKFTDLNPLLGFANWHEVWARYLISQPHVPNANYEWAMCGLLTVPSSYVPSNMNGFRVARGYNNGMGCEAYAHYGSGAAQSTYGWTANASAYDVIGMKISGGQIEHYIGQSIAGDFPDVSAMNFIGRSNIFGITAAPTFDGMCSWWSVMSGNTAGNSDLMLKKLLVQYR
jgi:hypothetical protein